MGLYQFTANPAAKTLDAIPLRATELHLNALPFLEPPPLVNLTIENLQFNGNIIEVDIGLRHPFLGLNEFTGFDVCGVFITNGSAAIAPNGDIYFINSSGTNEGLLIRLDSATGAILNSSGPWGQAGTRPAIGDSGLVYVNSRQHIRVFNPDCTLLWEYYGGSHNHFAAPALGEDGTLYSAKKELGLYAWHD